MEKLKEIEYVVFDVDNTLLPWRETYIKAHWNALKKHFPDSSWDEAKEISDAIDEYERHAKKYHADELLSFLNDLRKDPLPDSFIVDFLTELALCAEPVSEEIKELLAYLASKYELIIYSNWFSDNQKKRLEKAEIGSYFRQIYGGDQLPLKPQLEGFQQLCKEAPSKYVMIGDSLKNDIEPALMVGMQAIYYHAPKLGAVPNQIEKLIELKEIL